MPTIFRSNLIKIFFFSNTCLRVIGFFFLASLSSFQVLAGLSSSEDSKWILVDNFESENALSTWVLKDTRNDTKPYVTNPQVTEIRSSNPSSEGNSAKTNTKNQYLIKKPAAEGVVGNRKALTFKKLPARVNVGDTYTFYTRFNVEYFPNNHVFGLSNLDEQGIIEKDYNAFEPSLRITDKAESDGTKNDGTLMVKQGHAYAKVRNTQEKRVAKPLKPGIWYEVWYVVNNAKREAGGQRYDVFLKGGEFKEQTQVYQKADFRMQREQALGYFLMNCNTGPADKPYGNGGVRYDDIYMTKGINLTLPSSL